MRQGSSAGGRSKCTDVLLSIGVMIVGVTSGLLTLAVAGRTVLMVPSMRGYGSAPYAVLSTISLLMSAGVAVLVTRGSRRWLERSADGRAAGNPTQRR
jgi:hypothetical protein